MHFGLKYMQVKLFGKELKTTPKILVFTFLQTINNSKDFDNICFKNISNSSFAVSLSSFAIEKLSRYLKKDMEDELI